jgi:hypothetical protein
MFARVMLGCLFLAFAGIGLWTLVDPVTPLVDVGVVAADDRGIVELRAMYGGLELGLAGYLGWALLAKDRVWGGLLAGTCALGGLGWTRLAVWVWLMPAGWLLPILCLVEIGGSVAGIVALVLEARTDRPARAPRTT